ncbi:MAG: DUF922 domain-containing Zn-dependent protease [Hydrogenophaga sp.]|nr:DUF922 domain-containing Zn-dependent protease [Hydrogenophaga sp.]
MRPARLVRPLLFLSLLLAALLAQAEVRPSLQVQTYPVTYRADASLRQTITAASPVRHQGRTFHGYTRWNVKWQFWWMEFPGGQCRIDRTVTQVDAVITLPELRGAPTEAQQVFDRFVTALREHEMGHYQFGLDAAHRIDQAIAALPPQPSCTALQAAANQLGRRLLDEAIRAEIAYDRDTQHGRTQGAWLER